MPDPSLPRLGKYPKGGPSGTIDETSLISELIHLAEIQLAESHATIREQNTYALALAGFGGTIISIVVAAQRSLGPHWWLPIPGLAVAGSIAALGSTRIARDMLGPDPKLFYERFRETPPPNALAQLLVDVSGARLAVPNVLDGQRHRLRLSIAIFVMTAIYSTAWIAF